MRPTSRGRHPGVGRFPVTERRPARRQGLATDLSMGGWGAGGSAAGLGVPGQSLEQQPLPHREGLKRSLTSSPRWGTDRRLHLFGSSPCSETKLDAEMTMFESQMTRTVSDHLSSLISHSQAASPSPIKISGSEPVAADSSLEKKPSVGFLRRKRSGFSENHDDVQKDAESMYFPQIDTKEGRVLEMEDYCALKRWHFRFKYWTNNKSRMYVLENTGDFVRYHSLIENDVFIVYEDVRKNLVVRGQKKTRDDNLLDGSKASAPVTAPANATEDESDSRTTSNGNMPAQSG